MALSGSKRSWKSLDERNISQQNKRGKIADLSNTRIKPSLSSPIHSKEDNNDPLFWGPYLAERQWGTVREDYSLDGSCWDYLTFEDSKKQAYFWGEDGLLGISDKFGLLCASLALWNHVDPILKERLFGLNNNEGNHGEDVKELYYYLDNTPKHTYMKACYKYPQCEFPYNKLLHHGRTNQEEEMEISDTGIFNSQSYYDVSIEYAKPATHSIMCRITVHNCSSKPQTIDILPQFFFRNTWSGRGPSTHDATVPVFQAVGEGAVDAVYDMGIFRINFQHDAAVRLNSLLFTNNNSVASPPQSSQSSQSQESGDVNTDVQDAECGKKDAFHKFIINGEKNAVRRDGTGTKCCAWMTADMKGHSSTTVYWQIFPADLLVPTTKQKLDDIFTKQKSEAQVFYDKVIPEKANSEEKNICQQAIAGLLWSKQLYIYNTDMKHDEMYNIYKDKYLKSAVCKRHMEWKHLNCQDILLMPDKWEFPWFAAWDLAFHCVQYSRLDLPFAKEQIQILLSDRYMHTNGQIPGCEFNFSDPNPPIISWAILKIYTQDEKQDISFLKVCYHRLIFSFQWWSKWDVSNSYLYGNGFMGMDNISLFDRSKLPKDVSVLKQSDSTGWAGLFCLNMLQISLELCNSDKSYMDMAIKFLKQFLSIAKAINKNAGSGGLWSEEDSFFYDVVHLKDGQCFPIKVRSWSGIVPLLACATINLRHAPAVNDFLQNCHCSFAPYVCKLGDDKYFLSLITYSRFKSILKVVLSEDEFLSPYGIRSLSKIYKDNPYQLNIGDTDMSIKYTPGESNSYMFGGNSNWRGPIWLCMNYLFIECLERYSGLDNAFTLPLSIYYPTGQTTKFTFFQITLDLCQRIIKMFLPDERGSRPIHGRNAIYSKNLDWISKVLFYEFYHPDTGRGCGASHQTGWSGLVLELIHKVHKTTDRDKCPVPSTH